MDIQLAFVILVALLTGSAIVVSVYVVFVLKDFRGTIKKANGILDNAQRVTEAVKNPIVSIMSIADGVVKGIKTAKGVRSIVNLWDDDSDSKTKERNK
jgi:ABC-type nickel/cobalt efflux system permease component RcnA